MKQLFTLVFALFFILSSCSPSDDSDPVVAEGNYYPLASGNYWVYNFAGADNSGRDSLYIAKDTVINSENYKKFSAKSLPSGFYTNSVNNNSLRFSGDELLMTGSANLDFGDTLPVELSLTNFILFKESASNGQQLSSVSGTINQDYNGFPLIINYTLKTNAKETLPTFTAPDGTVYTEVKAVKTTLILKISATVEIVPGFSQNVVMLNTQDVISSTQYYANNIGVVYASTDVTYQLEDLPIEIGIPQSFAQNSKEILDIYKVN